LEGVGQKERALEMVRGIVQQFIDMRAPESEHPDTWDFSALRPDILSQFGYKVDPSELAGMTRLEMEYFICDRLAQKCQKKEELVGADIMRQPEHVTRRSKRQHQPGTPVQMPPMHAPVHHHAPLSMPSIRPRTQRRRSSRSPCHVHPLHQLLWHDRKRDHSLLAL
jgi:hypothetical protein